MEKVLGVGGVFYKSRNPEALMEWYKKHLGIEPAYPTGAVFDSKGAGEATVLGLFPRDTNYFIPSDAPYMINFRVANLERMLNQLRAMGAQVDGRTEQSEYGKFGWVMDPDGNRIELWEPPAP